jgi:hypothetical protein
MRFRPLSRDPFTDVGRTIPEFRSVGLALNKQLHGFSVDKQNVLEIDGQSIRFLFQCASQRVNMFPANPAAYEQHHFMVLANDSVDPAAHCGSSVLSIALSQGKTPANAKLMKTREESRFSGRESREFREFRDQGSGLRENA